MVCAANIILAAQTIVGRNVSPLDSAVLGLSAVQGGSLPAFSVVPTEVTITGTGRSYSKEVQDTLERRLRELVAGLAAGFGCDATVDYQRIYPATVNTSAAHQFAAATAREIFGEANVDDNYPASMGAEDFSFMLQAVPGCYAMIGQKKSDGFCPLHNNQYDFNDQIIPNGSAYLARLVERGLPL
jgi:hippurate hydrolase